MYRFAVPFEEDDKDPKTWFLDLDYIESMWEMFRKVNGTSSFPHEMWIALNNLTSTCSQGTTDWVLPHWSATTILRLGYQ